jgi:cytochrome b6-f complex iron-sulfur subunit
MGTRQKMKLYVVRARGRLLVLSPRCSHLGCFVNYNPLKEEFHCPCHGGRYDITGRVLAGPPPEPLSRLPWRIAHGWLQVGIREVA